MPRGGKEPGALEGLRDAKCDWDLGAVRVAGDEMVELDRGWDTESHVGIAWSGICILNAVRNSQLALSRERIMCLTESSEN